MKKSLQELINIDYNEAESNEKEQKAVIEKQFNILLNCTSRYHSFDYCDESKTTYIELKTRKCKSDKHQSTMIGFNKIEKAQRLKDKKKTVYFVWEFTDCLKYWVFDNYEQEWIGRAVRRDRGILESSKSLYIPNNKLIRFS